MRGHAPPALIRPASPSTFSRDAGEGARLALATPSGGSSIVLAALRDQQPFVRGAVDQTVLLRQPARPPARQRAA